MTEQRTQNKADIRTKTTQKWESSAVLNKFSYIEQDQAIS